MVMLRPSLTLVLDLDERAGGEETILEIKRNYTYITQPVVRTHAPSCKDEPVNNSMRMIVNMGARRYLYSSEEGADELWDDVVEHWIGNMLHKIGNNMRQFNVRQWKIGLPKVFFDRVDVVLQGGAFTVALRTDPIGFVDPSLKNLVTQARTLLNDGTIEGAVRVEAPSDEAYEAQSSSAYRSWADAHPDAIAAARAEEEAEAEKREEATPPAGKVRTHEELLDEDIVAKSYENTAVPLTDSETLPPVRRQAEPEEPERFDFAVDYTPWTVVYANGTRRAFDSRTLRFADRP